MTAPHSVGVVDQARAGADLARWEVPTHNVFGRFLFDQVATTVRKRRSMKKLSEADFQLVGDVVKALTLASVENDVDPFLLLAMAEIESSINPKAVGRVGEIGLMQIRPTTAQWMKRSCDLKNVYCNLSVGALYLSYLKNKLTQKWRVAPAEVEDLLLASYNEGPFKVWTNRVRRPASGAQADFNVIPVSSYASRVRARSVRLRERFQALLRQSLRPESVLVSAR